MAKTPAARPNRKASTPARAAVTVDTALLTLIDGDAGPVLAVLEVRRDAGGWALPTTFVLDGEPLVHAVLRSLRDQAGVAGVAPRQLQVLETPGRDDAGWTVSVAHVDAGPLDGLATRAPGTRLVPAAAPGRLPQGQAVVVARAVEDLQSRYAYAPDPDGFLADTFSLRELRGVHEAVAGYELQRDTFRRGMEPLLVTTGQVVVGGRGRPAELFSRA